MPQIQGLGSMISYNADRRLLALFGGPVQFEPLLLNRLPKGSPGVADHPTGVHQLLLYSST